MSHLRFLASTHFEATSARRAFPCFDEPSFKANFSVRIRRTPEYISLSNMPVVSVEYASHMWLNACKMATVNCLWIPGQDSWSKRWPPWGPVWCKCEDEHVSCSFCHLWLQICHCNNFFWSAGLPSHIWIPSFFYLKYYFLIHVCVSVGVHLCPPWKVAANPLCSGSCRQNARLLWGVFQYPLSSTQARYSFFTFLFN